jgi:hypothetical protein
MVVMDQFSRRIAGFAVYAGTVDGPAVCRMFNRIVSGSIPPQYLSSDNDPLFLFRQWSANLRILYVPEVKTVPYVPLSNPFVERLIGTVRREYLDQVPFWSARDLEKKLVSFQDYYNKDRVHRGLDGAPPNEQCEIMDRNIASGRLSLEKTLPWFVSAPSSSLISNSHPTSRGRKFKSSQPQSFLALAVIGLVSPQNTYVIIFTQFPMPNSELRTMMFETLPCAVLSFGENAQQTRNIGTRSTARDGSKSPETRKKSTLRTATYRPIRFRNLVLYPTELPGHRYKTIAYEETKYPISLWVAIWVANLHKYRVIRQQCNPSGFLYLPTTHCQN